MPHARIFRNLVSSAATLIGASTLVFTLVTPAAAQSIPGPLKVTDSGPSGSPGYAIKGITGYQNDTGVFGYGTVASSAINIDGVVGYVQTQQSVGVVGWAQSSGTSAYGVYGYSSTGPGVYGFNANGGAASIYGSNTSAGGLAILGISASGNAIEGETDYSGGGETAGLIGIDNTNDEGGNDGVYGATTSGYYGVWGASGTDALAGVYGSATDAYGTQGASVSNDGLHGSSTTGTGMAGISTTGFGSYSVDQATATPGPTAAPFLYTGGYAQSTRGPALYAVNVEDTGTGVGYNSPALYAALYGFGNDGAGIFAYSYSDVGAFVTNDNPFPTLYVNSDSGAGSATEYEIAAAVGNSASDLYNFTVDRKGDLFAAGSITSGTDTFLAHSRNPSAKVLTYSSQAAEATVEDFGSAQLVAGNAAVALAPDFRKTIDGASAYMVFLTPYGDNHGLYIASRTAAGFTVREAQSGRSTIAFDYRIVAHPYGSHLARLPAAADEARSKMAVGAGYAGHAAGARSMAQFASFQPSTASPQSARRSAKLAAFQRSLGAGPGSAGFRAPGSVMPKHLPLPSVHIPKM